MVIFLNAADSGRLGIGDEARVILDAVPDYVIPAEVSFVASDAQFTPKTVETESEREKLMFRVQLRVDRQVLKTYYGRVETGLRGSGFVRTRPDANWPPQLEVKLPPEPASPPIAEAPAPAPAEHAPALAPAPTPAAQTAAPAPTPAAQTAAPAPAAAPLRRPPRSRLRQPPLLRPSRRRRRLRPLLRRSRGRQLLLLRPPRKRLLRRQLQRRPRLRLRRRQTRPRPPSRSLRPSSLRKASGS